MQVHLFFPTLKGSAFESMILLLAEKNVKHVHPYIELNRAFMGIWSVLIESDVFQSGQLWPAGHFCPSANCGATPAPAGDLSPQCPRFPLF